jgi:hypothetical protein
MEREREGFAQLVPVVKAAATVLVLGLLVAAAGERSLAPLLMERPGDRTPDDARATEAVYRYAASYAATVDALHEPLEDF